MNVKDACLKKNTVRRKRMYVCPVKPVIENDSKKQHGGQRKVHRLPKKPNLRKEAFFTPLYFT